MNKVYLGLKRYTLFTKLLSGKRGSNPRPSAWEADALPTELLPQCATKLIEIIVKQNTPDEVFLPYAITVQDIFVSLSFVENIVV